jgi:hypothetical protein
MRAPWLIVLGFVATTSTAVAQTVGAFADLPARLNIGDDVTIEARSGVSIKGRLVRMTPEEIAVAGPDARERVFAATDVQRVRRRGDPLANGVSIGAMLGGAAGCAFGGLFSGEFRGGDCLQGLLIFGAAGAGLGLAVDAIHTGATTVFEPPTSGARLSPRLNGVAVRATLSW